MGIHTCRDQDSIVSLSACPFLKFVKFVLFVQLLFPCDHPIKLVSKPKILSTWEHESEIHIRICHVIYRRIFFRLTISGSHYTHSHFRHPAKLWSFMVASNEWRQHIIPSCQPNSFECMGACWMRHCGHTLAEGSWRPVPFIQALRTAGADAEGSALHPTASQLSSLPSRKSAPTMLPRGQVCKQVLGFLLPKSKLLSHNNHWRTHLASVRSVCWPKGEDRAFSSVKGEQGGWGVGLGGDGDLSTKPIWPTSGHTLESLWGR